MRDRYRAQAEQAPDEAALYSVLNRMCAELKESHLSALPPRREHELLTDHRAGVGIRWQVIDGRRVVTDVVPGSPAEAAGVKRGWLVTSRNEAPLQDSFVSRVGQQVRYGFLDEFDRPSSLALSPQLIEFDQLQSRELPGGLLYLRFDTFDSRSLSWLSQELKAHRTAPGVVIDLRANSGGSGFVLDMAIAEFFPRRVDEGRLVQRSGRAHEEQSFAWRSAHYAGRVVLLTGRATASAAEIFSHVLQYHGRATVIGHKTAGAVIYARIFDLPGGGGLQVPVIDYVGLDGQRLEGRGVTPNVVLPAPALSELRRDKDEGLATAIQTLQGGRVARLGEIGR